MHGDIIIPGILRSIYFALMHVHRVKQSDRREFLTCPSILNTNRVRDYTNLLRRCIKQVMNVFSFVQRKNISFGERWNVQYFTL